MPVYCPSVRWLYSYRLPTDGWLRLSRPGCKWFIHAKTVTGHRGTASYNACSVTVSCTLHALTLILLLAFCADTSLWLQLLAMRLRHPIISVVHWVADSHRVSRDVVRCCQSAIYYAHFTLSRLTINAAAINLLLPPDAMHSAAYAVTRCTSVRPSVSVCLSVCDVRVFCRND